MKYEPAPEVEEVAMSSYPNSVDDLLNEIIDITQATQWQFSPAMCSCEAAQKTLNDIYELAHRVKEKITEDRSSK